MTFRRWELISVPFPFVEGAEAKRRPALVVSTDAFHSAHDACFAAMVTTAREMQDVRVDDIVIDDWAKSGLPRPCVIRLARLVTVQDGASVRRIGMVGLKERQRASGLLKRWIGA